MKTWQRIDAAGVLRGYDVEVYSGGARQYTTTYTQEYLKRDTYLQTTQRSHSERASGGASAPDDTATRHVYDAHDELVKHLDLRDSHKDRIFTNNAAGEAVTVIQGNPGGTLQMRSMFAAALSTADNSARAQHFFFAKPRFSRSQVLPDAFGNALGNSIVIPHN